MKRLVGLGVHVGMMCPIRSNVLWELDFQFDNLADGRMIQILNIFDGFIRECSGIEVGRTN